MFKRTKHIKQIVFLASILYAYCLSFGNNPLEKLLQEIGRCENKSETLLVEFSQLIENIENSEYDSNYDENCFFIMFMSFDPYFLFDGNEIDSTEFLKTFKSKQSLINTYGRGRKYFTSIEPEKCFNDSKTPQEIFYKPCGRWLQETFQNRTNLFISNGKYYEMLLDSSFNEIKKQTHIFGENEEMDNPIINYMNYYYSKFAKKFKQFNPDPLGLRVENVYGHFWPNYIGDIDEYRNICEGDRVNKISTDLHKYKSRLDTTHYRQLSEFVTKQRSRCKDFIAKYGVVEKWICTNYDGDILVTAEVRGNKYSGVIKVAGVDYEAQYEVKGFNRRWDFGLSKDKTYDYAFILEPDGSGSYYDFSGKGKGTKVKPSQYFNSCRQAKK